MCSRAAVNVKTGEICPASFPEKGPALYLRSARTLAGGHHVSVQIQDTFRDLYFINEFLLSLFVIDVGHLRCKPRFTKNWPVQLRASSWSGPVVAADGRIHCSAPFAFSRGRGAQFRHEGTENMGAKQSKRPAPTQTHCSIVNWLFRFPDAFNVQTDPRPPVPVGYVVPRQPTAFLQKRRSWKLDTCALLGRE